MRTFEEYRKILYLFESGNNKATISKITNIPYWTIRDCIVRFKNLQTLNQIINKQNYDRLNFLERIKYPANKSDFVLRQAYAYILGIYLGDGCITLQDEKKKIYRLRITCDAKYPNIINQISDSLKLIMPANKIGFIKRYYQGHLSCIDISCYSKLWSDIFSFYRVGRKHTYSIELENWHKEVIKSCTKDFWIGLYQSDGSRFYNKQSKQIEYNFTQKSTDITNLFCWACDILNIGYGAYWCPSRAAYTVSIVKSMDVANIEKFAKPKS